jgi:hypothetical protein
MKFSVLWQLFILQAVRLEEQESSKITVFMMPKAYCSRCFYLFICLDVHHAGLFAGSSCSVDGVLDEPYSQ